MRVAGASAWATLAALTIPAAMSAARAADAVAASTDVVAAASADTAAATTADAAAGSGVSGALEEVTVTGSHIKSAGFESPTPLTTISADEISKQATPDLIDYLSTLPVFGGNYTPQSSSQNASSGTAGTASINMRNLGANRTLVLIDGQRVVPSTVTGLVDVNMIPTQLLQRVDVVTGGASASYGSDAVAGVVNFILDKKFTGIKADLSGGVTQYGDDPEFKVSLTGGTAFAGGRGHLIVSGQHTQEGGVLDGDRPWNEDGWQLLKNPGCTPNPGCSGVPSYLLLDQVAPANMTPGGIINSGPLKGVAFGQGGSPYIFQYGPIVSGSAMAGGSWDASLHVAGQSIQPKLTSNNLFLRGSFDVTDHAEVYFQSSLYMNEEQSHAYPNEYLGGITVPLHALPGGLVSNPYLEQVAPSVAQAAAAAGVTSLSMGSWNEDLGPNIIDTHRNVLRNVIGSDGDFDLFSTNWKWDGYVELARSKGSETDLDSINMPNYTQAVNTTINPATGAVVCFNPSNGCVPYNPFGIGVNSKAAIAYVTGDPHRDEFFRQNVEAASISGDPFSDWAGKVSIAAGIEHRYESVSGDATANDLAGVYYATNYRPTFGNYSVTEGFLETVIPLAKDLPFAQLLELNGGGRATDYSTSGFVTTWKVGLVWRPIDDIMLRATQSRDIRAPNLNDLYNAGTIQNNSLNSLVAGTDVQYQSDTRGNPDLKPEAGVSTDIGIVLQPSFLPALNLSVDYWNVDIKNAISSISVSQIDLLCAQGGASFCAALNPGTVNQGTLIPGMINTINVQPFNLAEQLVRGLDFEGSYHFPLSGVFGPLLGDVSLRALATKTIKDYSNNTLTVPTDIAGANGSGMPTWRFTTSMTYDLNGFSTSLTARGISSGTYNNTWVQCTSGCPASTVNNPTANVNTLAGAIYFDLSASYKFDLAKSDSSLEVFMNIKNLSNRDPVIVAGGPSGIPFDTVSTNPSLYDSLGRVYEAGVRFKL